MCDRPYRHPDLEPLDTLPPMVCLRCQARTACACPIPKHEPTPNPGPTEDDWAPCLKTADVFVWAIATGALRQPRANAIRLGHHTDSEWLDGLVSQYLEAHPKKVTAEEVYRRHLAACCGGSLTSDGGTEYEAPYVDSPLHVRMMAQRIADLENEKREAGR